MSKSCANCGAKILEGAAVCDNCGMPVSEAASPAPTRKASAQPPRTLPNTAAELSPEGSIEGETVSVGRACPGDPAVPPASEPGQIAVVERGVCVFTEKFDAVAAAGGYEAIVVFNQENKAPLAAAIR